METKKNLLGQSTTLDGRNIIIKVDEKYLQIITFTDESLAKKEFNRICCIRRGSPCGPRRHKRTIAIKYDFYITL